jgi:predicted hotdog family 3-hydroxylacyl-ACP dehydratase
MDNIAADLEVVAERLSGDGNTILYGFHVSAAGRELLSGRAAVVLDAALLDVEKLGNLK